jgi:acetyl esterase/lipase
VRTFLHRFANASALAALLAVVAPAAHSQVSTMPPDVQKLLAEIGPVWGKDILGNVEKTLKAYDPVLKASPKTGVTVERDVAYGPDPRHRLDLYRPTSAAGVPVVVFFHGGAYVRGERDVSPEVYGNVATYFARNGMLGVNATYRLAPAARWPAAAQDVGSVVAWLKENAAKFGGDPARIYVIGHSAGATHLATYAFVKALQPASGHGLAGIVLMSGRYHFDPKPDDPNLKNFQAYFGADPTQYPKQSPINYVKEAPRIPIYIVIAEYDNPDLDTQGALLLAAICERDRACPRFTRMDRHNHLSMVYQFNTADELLGREILEFMRRGR